MTLARPHCRSRRAFTLIELLVTISIIVVLASITLMAIGGVNNNASRARAVGEISALNTALENYKIDNGAYPYDDGATFPTASDGSDYAPNPSGYADGSKFLLRQLVGEKLGDKSYFQIQESQLNDPSSTPYDTDNYLVDPWGYAYGYSPAEPGTSDTPSFNVGFFDLWSTGGGTSDEEDEIQGWIVNWPDDIRRSVN